MATPNYSYEKRQRELAKKRKAEEKRMRKNDPQVAAAGDQASDAPDASEEVGQAEPVNPAVDPAG